MWGTESDSKDFFLIKVLHDILVRMGTITTKIMLTSNIVNIITKMSIVAYRNKVKSRNSVKTKLDPTSGNLLGNVNLSELQKDTHL